MKTVKSMIAAVILMLIFVLPVSAAGTVYTEGALNYTVGEGTITIVGYFGREEEVTVPSQIAGVPINTIAKGAFVGTNAKVVNLPDTIMTVEEGAFGADIVVNFMSNTKHSETVSGGEEQSKENEPENEAENEPENAPENEPENKSENENPGKENSGTATEQQEDEDFGVDEAEDYLGDADTVASLDTMPEKAEKSDEVEEPAAETPPTEGEKQEGSATVGTPTAQEEPGTGREKGIGVFLLLGVLLVALVIALVLVTRKRKK